MLLLPVVGPKTEAAWSDTVTINFVMQFAQVF